MPEITRDDRQLRALGEEVEGIEDTMIRMRKELLETIDSQKQRIAELEAKLGVLVELLVQGGGVDRSMFDFRIEAALDAVRPRS